jgi:hypothetical protein
MESESARAGLWPLPRVHALHASLPRLGTWSAHEGGSSQCLRTGTRELLDDVRDPAGLTAWSQGDRALETASPWDSTPAWLARAPTCVRWIAEGDELHRRLAWTQDGAVQVRALPRRADPRSVRLRHAHPQHPGGGEWIASPTPEGIDLLPLGRPGRRRRVPLAEIDAALAHDLGGHPQFAGALHRRGLRWDGEEIYLDCLRPGTEALADETDTILTASDGIQLSHTAGQGDRVYWRQPGDPVTWVLPHPVLAQVPHPIRHMAARRRPRVTMCAWAIDEQGGYLGLWRAHGDRATLELWSLRAHDRLKAWYHRPSGGPSRLVLRRPTPDHLPLLWALEVRGGDIRVCLVEFGDREVGPPTLLRGAAAQLGALVPVDDGVWAAGGARFREVT